MLQYYIAYERTNKPQRQRIDDSQAPATTEVQYESIEPVHEYEDVLLWGKQVVQNNYVIIPLYANFVHSCVIAQN